MSRLTSFAWWVPIHGFQWETRDDNADESGPWLRPRPVRVSDLLPGTFDLPTRRYGPLDQHSALFHDFADLPLTTATIQRFADCYGPLTKDGIMPLGGVAYPGDNHLIQSLSPGEAFAIGVRQFKRCGRPSRFGSGSEATIRRRCPGTSAGWITARTARGFITALARPPPRPSNAQSAEKDWEHQGDTIASNKLFAEWLPRLQPGEVVAPALVYLARLVDKNLQGRLGTLTVPDLDAVGMTFTFVPDGLLSALWLQFALGIEKGLTYRACKVCNSWFELSPAIARTNRLFCSNACKFKDYREKQDRARQMKASGQGFAAIAKALGSDVATVKRWVTGRRK